MHLVYTALPHVTDDWISTELQQGERQCHKLLYCLLIIYAVVGQVQCHQAGVML